MSITREIFTTKVNSTMMSMDERFTFLRKNARPMQMTLQNIRANNAVQQQASAKNRRLAMQMEKRLSAMVALKLKKKSIRQRLGVPGLTAGQGSIRDRLTLPLRGRGRLRGIGKARRGRGGNLRRTQSLQSLQTGGLQRSRSMQSLNEAPIPRGRSRSRSRSRARGRAPSQGPRATSATRRQRSNSRGRQGRPLQRSGSVGPQRRFSTGAFGQQSQQRRRSRSVGMQNRGVRNQGLRGNRNTSQRGGQKSMVFRRNSGNFGRNNNQPPQSGRGRGRGRGRSSGRGRRGAGRGGVTRPVMPTKEELDKQLDQYMAKTKSHLDGELDTYMKESGLEGAWN